MNRFDQAKLAMDQVLGRVPAILAPAWDEVSAHALLSIAEDVHRIADHLAPPPANAAAACIAETCGACGAEIGPF